MVDSRGTGAETDARLGDDRTAAELLDLVAAERASIRAAIEPDPRVVYGVWGVAWLVGFACMYAAHGGGPVDVADGVAGVVFFVLLVAAALLTAVHMSRRLAGFRGVTRRAGAMYGWAWLLGFASLAAIMTALNRGGLSDTELGLAWSAGSGLVAGLLYLAGGALWQDRVQYGLGAWIVVVSGAGALAGSPAIYLVMSLAGGGGFLLAAATFALRSRRTA
ncbi:MAG: hypothetical protein ABJA93_10135 [Sporichthyaceae bacterium]